MQILANALPGFRDLRAPLIAGYIWLLFAWLIAQPDLDHQSTGLGGSLYDLAQRTGPLWIAAAVGVAAYLIGAVSQAISHFLREATLELSLFGLWAADFTVPVRGQLDRILQRGEAMIEGAARDRGLSSRHLNSFYRQLSIRHDEALREGERELDLPATLLVGDQSELFAEVDRLRAEGELRVAVVPPLLALGILLAIEDSYWWLLLLPAVASLFVQGVQKHLDSKKIIADASQVGRVQASSIEKFARWVDETLPTEMERGNRSVTLRGAD